MHPLQLKFRAAQYAEKEQPLLAPGVVILRINRRGSRGEPGLRRARAALRDLGPVRQREDLAPQRARGTSPGDEGRASARQSPYHGLFGSSCPHYRKTATVFTVTV